MPEEVEEVMRMLKESGEDINIFDIENKNK